MRLKVHLFISSMLLVPLKIYHKMKSPLSASVTYCIWWIKATTRTRATSQVFVEIVETVNSPWTTNIASNCFVILVRLASHAVVVYLFIILEQHYDHLHPTPSTHRPPPPCHLFERKEFVRQAEQAKEECGNFNRVWITLFQ